MTNFIPVILIFSTGILVFSTVMVVLNSKKTLIKKRVGKIASLKSMSDLNTESIYGDDDIGFLSLIKISDKFRRYLLSSGVKLKPQEFIVIWFGTGFLIPFIYYLLMNSMTSTFLVMIVGIAIPPMYVEYAKNKRAKIFNLQLSQALLIISNSLRSGFTFRHALARVAQDLPDPISEEFKRVIREVNYGAKLDDSLSDLADRMNSDEFKMINSAVSIQQKAGGNLAHVIEMVSITITDRINIKKTITTLTAQGRMSGMIIGLLPVFMLLVLMLVSPSYISIFFDIMFGMIMLVVSGILELIGFMFIKKIVDIEY